MQCVEDEFGWTFAHHSARLGEQLRRAHEPGRHLITMKRQCRTTFSDTFSFSSSPVRGTMFRRPDVVSVCVILPILV